MVQSIKLLKNSPVKGRDGLGNKSNMKMSKSVQNWLLCIICQLSNSHSWTMDETHNFNC